MRRVFDDLYRDFGNGRERITLPVILKAVRLPAHVDLFPGEAALMGGEHLVHDRVECPLIAEVDRKAEAVARQIGQPLVNGMAVKEDHVTQLEGAGYPLAADFFEVGAQTAGAE